MRTLDTLREDLRRFTDSGGDIKFAKLYNNVIGETLLDIPLDMVKNL